MPLWAQKNICLETAWLVGIAASTATWRPSRHRAQKGKMAVLADAPANPLAVLKDGTLPRKAPKTFPHYNHHLVKIESISYAWVVL
jgi:hypothetical protein